MLQQLAAAAIIPTDFSIFGVQARDVIDILVVSVLIYAVLLLLKKTHSLFLFNGIGLLVLIYIGARWLNLYLTSLFFSVFFGFFVIIFVVVFQQELRRFFEWLSAWRRFSYLGHEAVSDVISNQIIQAVDQLAKLKTGALIVLPGEQPVDLFMEGGVVLEGKVSVPLLLSIFDSSSPGHDGAAIIQGDRVRAFGVHLPLSRRVEELKNFGTRHRAALGLSERADSLVIVVSEEKGIVSLAEEGEIRALSDADELTSRIHDFLRRHLLENGAERKRWSPMVNLREKIVSLFLAVLLWYVFAVQLGAGTITRNFEIPIEFRSLQKEYMIEQISPVEIDISLSGSNQDFNFFNPDNLKVVVNLADVADGKHMIEINEKDIVNLPATLSVIKMSPLSIQISIKKPEPPEEENPQQ